jgi:PAS domain S-box-containing protein
MHQYEIRENGLDHVPRSDDLRIHMISVLYVEDDTSLLEIGKFLLEKDDSVRVDTCSSVNDALKKISEKRYDVIISDYAMPVTNGIKFLKTLRSGGDTTPFFFFAGKGRKSVIIDALNLGADFYLEKAGNAKVQFEELMHEVKRAAERTSTSANVDRSPGISGSVPDAVAEGVLVVDPFGKVAAYNQNFLSLLKIPKELTGIGSDSAVLLEYIRDHVEDPDDLFRKIETISTDPGISCQGTIHGKGGQVFFWSSQAQKTGGTISGRIWSFCDISEQHRTGLQLAAVTGQLKAAEEELHHLRKELEEKEELLHKNEEVLDIIRRTTPDGIFTSIGGTITGTNEQFAEMLGYGTPELAGRSLLDFVSPDSPGEVLTSVRSGSGGRYEYAVLQRDGSSFRVEATGYPVRYQGDTILVSIVRRVPGTALPQKGSPAQEEIPVEAEPDREEAGTRSEPVSVPSPVSEPEPVSVPLPVSIPEPVSEPGSEGEIRPEHAPFVSVPAGITTKGKTGISLTWEVDDAHPAADIGEGQPSYDIDTSSLITEIDDVIGPDTDEQTPGKGRWFSPDIRGWFSGPKRKKK